jgi:hypothetical protein
VSQLARADQQYDTLAALRTLEGRATVGDVVAATGMDVPDVQAALKELLESHRGQLAVTDSGELLYEFDPRFIRRGSEPLLARAKRTASRVFEKAFKAWIVVMLVVYFVVFVVLVIAALVAGQRGDGDRGGLGGGRRGGHHHGGLPIPNLWLWYWIWGPRWHLGRPYYGRRWERTLEKDDRVPFYKKVFAFVFGPDEPRPTQRQLDRSILRLVRARNGVLTAPELVEHTGLPRPEAEQEMGRLMGSYDGEPVPTPSGEVAYTFPGLMMSAGGQVREREPNPAWLRLEYPKELTGNTAGANAAVVGINAFNLVAAASAPWFIFPRLGLGGPAAWVGLVLVPVVFSFLFFAIPGLRMLSVVRENRRRRHRNVRKVVLGLVYRRAMEGRPVSVEEAHRHANERLEKQTPTRSDAESALHELAAEFDADVTPADDGTLLYRFPVIRDAMASSEEVRRQLSLEGREPGAIVFHTGDSAVEAGERDLEAFDRELLGYVPDTDRVGYEADYELVAFDEELKRRGLVEA